MNEEAEARFNQSMVSHSESGIALFCIEVDLTPKCIFITNMLVFLPHHSQHKQNFLIS